MACMTTSNIKPDISQWKATLCNDNSFPKVNRTIYCREFLTSNQMSCYIGKCIRKWFYYQGMSPKWAGRMTNEPLHDKTNKMTVHSVKTQISLGIRPVWSVFTERSIGSRGPNVSSCRQRRLIRLGGCPGWSESLLGTHAILLVLSWGNPRRLICVFVVRIKQVLSLHWSASLLFA